MLHIPIKLIRTDECEEFDSVFMADLKISLLENGQREPIEVVKLRKKYRVVNGRKRLEAFRDLGWTVISAIIVKEAVPCD